SLFPSPTLFRSRAGRGLRRAAPRAEAVLGRAAGAAAAHRRRAHRRQRARSGRGGDRLQAHGPAGAAAAEVRADAGAARRRPAADALPLHRGVTVRAVQGVAPEHLAASRATRLFLALAGFLITDALLAEFVGVKIFSLERTFGAEEFQWNLFGVTGTLNFTTGVVYWPMVFVLTD